MIYFYWPGKSIPSWLYTFSFFGENSSKAQAKHGGIGLLINVRDEYLVYSFFGNFLVVKSYGCSLEITREKKCWVFFSLVPFVYVILRILSK